MILTHIPARDKKEEERERETERKRGIKTKRKGLRDRKLNCKRGNSNTCTYIHTGNVFDDKFVTLDNITY